MTVPLAVLAVLSIIGGWIGLPLIEGGHRIKAWLAPSLGGGHESAHAVVDHAAQAAHHAQEVTLMIVSVLVALYPAVTVALAAAVLHERIHRAQAVGLGLAAAAVSLISLA
jgi:drug/metabolite transporter (DMT)-like permease